MLPLINLLIEQFASNFKGRNLPVVFPSVCQQLVSTRVLVMSWEEGVSLQELSNSLDMSKKKQAASIGFKVFMNMVISDNFLHSDCHAGNVLYRSVSGSKDEIQLVVLDAGLVAVLSANGRRHLRSLLVDVVKNDGFHAADMFISLSMNGCPAGAGIFRQQVVSLFKKEIGKGKPAYQPVNVGSLLSGLLNLVRESKMTLQSEFASIVITMV